MPSDGSRTRVSASEWSAEEEGGLDSCVLCRLASAPADGAGWAERAVRAAVPAACDARLVCPCSHLVDQLAIIIACLLFDVGRNEDRIKVVRLAVTRLLVRDHAVTKEEMKLVQRHHVPIVRPT